MLYYCDVCNTMYVCMYKANKNNHSYTTNTIHVQAGKRKYMIKSNLSLLLLV